MALLDRQSERLADEPADFWATAGAQRACAQCGRFTREWDAHHVVEKQELSRRKLPLWDRRNALRLCNGPFSCHGQHTGAGSRVQLRKLRNENYEYAFEVLGAYAYDYLRRRYRGEDPRLERWLERYERQDSAAAHFASIS